MADSLSPRQFARAIGVSESSVRRWADSGRITMAKTAGGHRRISRAEAIRFVRENALTVLHPELLEIEEPTHRRGRAEAWLKQDHELLQALQEGRADLVTGLLEAMYLSGSSIAEICDGPLRKAMYRIGTLWEQNANGIFIEHRASTISQEALVNLQRLLPERQPPLPLAIGGAPQDDPYLLPSRMVAAVLREIGFQATDLGPYTPLEILSRSARQLQARLLWISFTASQPTGPLNQEIQTLIDQLADTGIQIVTGGQSRHRYAVPDRPFVQTFPTLSELAGFARSRLKLEQLEP